MIPEFAIIGHPNEGKSSVLSTLAEDDSVRISPIPGETTHCRTFPVVVDGVEILRFTDTPGFQNPKRVLSELRKIDNINMESLKRFRDASASSPELKDDCELLLPIVQGAGIIYVVDGSRPLRNVDKAEMEILRLTGRPRMAIINCKRDSDNHLADWKNAFSKSFNSSRLFNAHRATYAERILLLEALKNIDQDWQRPLNDVVVAFKKDWARRTSQTGDIICSMLQECLFFSVEKSLGDDEDETALREQMLKRYTSHLEQQEQAAHSKIRGLFKHNIFNYTLPPHSILNETLFHEKTWQLLGLDKKQLMIAGGIGGAAIGAKLDLLAAGMTFGVFTSLGGILGSMGVLWGGESFSTKSKLFGLRLGGQKVRIGPIEDPRVSFILLDRALIYYSHTINWAHGKRDLSSVPTESHAPVPALSGYVKQWPSSHIKACHAYFKAIRDDNPTKIEQTELPFRDILTQALNTLSQSDR